MSGATLEQLFEQLRIAQADVLYWRDSARAPGSRSVRAFAQRRLARAEAKRERLMIATQTEAILP